MVKLLLQLRHFGEIGLDSIGYLGLQSKLTPVIVRLVVVHVTQRVIEQVVVVDELIPLVIHSVVALVHHVVREFRDLRDARVVRLRVIWYSFSPAILRIEVVAISSALTWTRWSQQIFVRVRVEIIRSGLVCQRLHFLRNRNLRHVHTLVFGFAQSHVP